MFEDSVKVTFIYSGKEWSGIVLERSVKFWLIVNNFKSLAVPVFWRLIGERSHTVHKALEFSRLI